LNVCPRCQAKLETPLACSACGALAEIELGAKPDPFALFGLEHAYELDAAMLKKRLLRFTRLVHPDFFAGAEAQERARAEAASAALNAAHTILSEDAARADWLVCHFGGPDEQTERSMPQSFLMEVLEWNETLEAARESAPDAPQRRAVEQLETELSQQRRKVFESIARRLGAPDARERDTLALVRQDLNAARYLDKTLAEIASLRVAQSLSKQN
jgi:molecular chaperone HscB